jgi:tetratricopeptide (TPR) repeat protein
VITAVLFLWLAFQGVSPEGAKHMHAGVEAQKQGQFDVAIKEFRKATESDPNLAEAFLDLGQVLQQAQDYPGAVVALKRALELNPELDAAHLQLGFALLAQGYAEESIPHLERAHAVIALGIAQTETGRYEAAVANLSAALAEHPGNPDLLYYLGRASGLLSKRSIDSLVALYPDSPRAHQAMGENYFVLRQMPQAEKEYLVALEQRPELPGLHLELGMVYTGAADLRKAEEAFRYETRLQPGSAEAAYRLGTTLLQQGKGKEARVELERADRLQPDMPETLYSLGKAASLEGNSALAERSWNRLLGIEKDTALAAQTHFALAALYRKAGDAAKAKQEMQEYQKLQGKILETQTLPK